MSNLAKDFIMSIISQDQYDRMNSRLADEYDNKQLFKADGKPKRDNKGNPVFEKVLRLELTPEVWLERAILEKDKQTAT